MRSRKYGVSGGFMFSRSVVMLYAFGIICLIWVVSTTGDNTKNNPSTDDKPKNVIDMPNANTLVDVYDNNELDGDEKYKNRWIKTTAFFNRTYESIDYRSLTVYFDVKNENGEPAHYGIICFDVSKAEIDNVSNFEKGEPVIFIGLNQGILVSDLYFIKCELPEY